MLEAACSRSVQRKTQGNLEVFPPQLQIRKHGIGNPGALRFQHSLGSAVGRARDVGTTPVKLFLRRRADTVPTVSFPSAHTAHFLTGKDLVFVLVTVLHRLQLAVKPELSPAGNRRKAHLVLGFFFIQA